MSGKESRRKKPLDSRELNYSFESGVSDSGYTTQLDMEQSQSQGKVVGATSSGAPTKSPALTIPTGRDLSRYAAAECILMFTRD